MPEKGESILRWKVRISIGFSNNVNVEVEAKDKEEAKKVALENITINDFDIVFDVDDIEKVDPEHPDKINKIAEEIVGIECEGQMKMFS